MANVVGRVEVAWHQIMHCLSELQLLLALSSSLFRAIVVARVAVVVGQKEIKLCMQKLWQSKAAIMRGTKRWGGREGQEQRGEGETTTEVAEHMLQIKSCRDKRTTTTATRRSWQRWWEQRNQKLLFLKLMLKSAHVHTLSHVHPLSHTRTHTRTYTHAQHRKDCGCILDFWRGEEKVLPAITTTRQNTCCMLPRPLAHARLPPLVISMQRKLLLSLVVRC